FLTPEVCRKWRIGYLPRDTGEDKSGGTMRGKIVYPYLSESGEVLTWFGRDPEFEEKHQKWEASDRSEREPEKFHFVKGFLRGIERHEAGAGMPGPADCGAPGLDEQDVRWQVHGPQSGVPNPPGMGGNARVSNCGKSRVRTRVRSGTSRSAEVVFRSTVDPEL